MSWIKFTFHSKSDSGLTSRWSILRTNGVVADGCRALGWVAWYAPWRKYTMFSVEGITFDASCLRDIADFCEQQTREHKS